MTVQEAQTALDTAVSKKNAADSALVDAGAKEKDLSAQIDRVNADQLGRESNDESKGQLAVLRTQREQARQDIEDLEGAIRHVDQDVATARQAVFQAKQSGARGVMREQEKALKAGVAGLEQALQDVAQWSQVLITAGSRARDAATAIGQPQNFAAGELVAATLHERTAPLIGGTAIGGRFTAPVADTFAALIADAEVLGMERA